MASDRIDEKNRITKGWFHGFVLGIFLLIATLLLTTLPEISRKSVFDSIKLDDPPASVSKVLVSHNIKCELDYLIVAGNSSNVKYPCFFSDFWRQYSIRFDSTGRVIAKEVRYKLHFPSNLIRQVD